MKKLLPLLLALCLTLSACAAPAAVPLPGDSVTAVTVAYAGKTVTCTDPAQVRAMTDAARSLEFVPTDASVTTPGAMSMELTFTDSSGSAVTLTLPLTQSGGKVYDAGADSIFSCGSCPCGRLPGKAERWRLSLARSAAAFRF